MKAAYKEGVREIDEAQEGKDEELWQEDAEDLYQWTQTLSFDDIT